MTPEVPEENKTILTSVSLVRLEEGCQRWALPLAVLYFHTWAPEGLCQSPAQALRQIRKYDPKGIFCLLNSEGDIFSSAFTATAEADSVLHLLNQIPTYSCFEDYRHDPGALEQQGRYQFRICFSINSDLAHRIQTRGMQRDVSPTQHLLTKVPKSKDAFVVAYSRITGIGREPPLDYLLKNMADPRKLGSVGMHLHLGGLPLAIIEDSRPEDLAGGKRNWLVVYPRNEKEGKLFREITNQRIKNGKIPHVKKGNFTIFTDFGLIPSGLSNPRSWCGQIWSR